MIEIKNLTKRFDKVVAVNNISATIPEGTICGLAGSNGSGKSTLLRMLSGVYEPNEGAIIIDGELGFENISVKGKSYYVPDYPYYPNGATLKKMSKYLREIYPNWDEEYYKMLCHYFPVGERKRIITMSKGMQRQASLILALATRPKYLYLDEIFDGLDPVIRQTLKKLLVENVADNNMTVVIASHNLREFNDICDSMLLLHQGEVVRCGGVDEMKSSACRVQIAFKEDVQPEIFDCIKLRNFSQNGRVFSFIALGDEEEIREKLNNLNPVFMDILPLTLEEAFINEMEGVGYEVI